jgi:hypothetical protein
MVLWVGGAIGAEVEGGVEAHDQHEPEEGPALCKTPKRAEGEEKGRRAPSTQKTGRRRVGASHARDDEERSDDHTEIRAPARQYDTKSRGASEPHHLSSGR